MNILKQLLSGSENCVDSTVFGSLSALAVFFGISIFTVIHDPSTWSAMGFAGAAAAIIGIGTGSKITRDKLTPQTNPPQA